MEWSTNKPNCLGKSLKFGTLVRSGRLTATQALQIEKINLELARINAERAAERQGEQQLQTIARDLTGAEREEKVMPRLPDKIVINWAGFWGRVLAIRAEFKALKKLGKEIIAKGWADETTAKRDELKVECGLIDSALDRYLEHLRGLKQWMADFIDNHP
jgi:hypothetical protein